MAIDRGPADDARRGARHRRATVHRRDRARATALAGADGASLLNMARVGAHRARLDLGNLTGAADDAILAPVGLRPQRRVLDRGGTAREPLLHLTHTQ